jgi:nucleoside-diphosphate-sugar epimerase
VGDVIEGLLALSDTDGLEGQAFNLGSTEEITMLKLAQLISEITGAKIVHGNPNHGDSLRRLPDVSMNSAISWEAKTPLQEGLSQLR